MTKISSAEIADVIRYDNDKIIIVEKIPYLDSGSYKANYFIFNFKTLEKEVITKSAYLLKKFGNSFNRISEVISGFAQCDSVILSDRSVFVMFPNGQCGLFDSDGELMWRDTIKYNDSVVNSLAQDGDYIWCCCRDENCVIRYSIKNRLLSDIRIGAREAKTFILPSALSSDEENIYVVCNNAKLRSINKKDFSVQDVGRPIPGLERFYRFKTHTLICTKDGAYVD